jgi:hypothetical protein
MNMLKYKLNTKIQNQVRNGKTMLLEKHVEDLQSQKKSFKDQYDQVIKSAQQEAIKSSVAYSYTNREEDTNNELNQFEPVGLKKLLKNIVQRVGSVTNALKSTLLRENDISDKEIASIKYFNDNFNKPFQQTIEQIFEPKGDRFYRFKDMIKYLPFRDATNPKEPASVTYEGNTYTSKLDVPTKTAMAATMYEWLHTNGTTATGQTTESLRDLMGYGKDEPMPDSLVEHLMKLGVPAEALAKQLGSKILQRMSIKPTETSDMNAKARLEMSLGFMAIAAMETMKTKNGKPYFERQEVYTGKEDGTRGIEALKNNETLETGEVFHPQTAEQRAFDSDPKNEGKNGKSTAKFLKLVSDHKYDTPTHMTIGEEHMSNAPGAFDKLFDNESDATNFSWSKIFMPDNAPIGRNGTVGKKQTANLKKNVDVAYDASQHSMDVFQALGEGSALDAIIGMVDDTHLLETRNKSVDGANRGIQRDLKNLKAWMRQADLRKTENQNTLFYIAAKFMNNMRMIQTGNLNPQNSKMHRNLFSPTSWLTEFNPKTDKATDNAFLQAVALSFGIESGKVGGVDNQLTQLTDLLKKDVFANAIKAIQTYQATGVMNDTQKSAIAAGVVAGKEKLHSLKGLVEYARYEAYKSSEDPGKGLFKTDMYNEIDGVSNGPIIGIMMLIPDSADKREVLASLAMGGMSIDRRKTAPNLDKLLGQYNLNDAYQRMAQQWALKIAEMKKQLRLDSKNSTLKDDVRNKANRQYNYSMALETLLGRFTEHVDKETGEIVNEGIINSLIRKLAKPRTMQTMYSAGINKQNMILTGENVISDGIYGGIEKVIKGVVDNKSKDIVEADLKKILKSVAVLTNSHDGKPSSEMSLAKYMTNGNLDINKLKKFKLDKDAIKLITKATRETYGQAMEDAIDTVYAPVIEARKPFNTLIQRAATVYNLVLKSKVDAQIAANAAEAKAKGVMVEKKDVGRITNAQLQVILKSIEHLIPKIKTPDNTDNDHSYLTLAEVGRQKDNAGNKTKDYSDAATVSQSYTAESGLSPFTGYVDSIPYLKEVGASAMVRSIQMIDSMVANHLMGLEGVDILNAHDGFPHSIKDSEAVRDSANQRFFDVVSNYSLGQAMFDMHTEMELKQTLENAISSNDISQPELIAALFKDNVVNFDTYGYSKEEVRMEVGLIRQEARESGDEIPYKAAQQQFLREVSGFRETNTEAENKEALDNLFNRVTFDAKHMAEEVTNNKKEITGNITQSAQYPLNGIGVTIEPSNPSKTLFADDKKLGNVKPNSVLTMDAENTNIDINSLKDLGQEKFFASSANDTSTNENDYVDPITNRPNTENIDSQNVVDKFDSILALDNQAAHTSVQNSPEHVADLKRILNDIVARVMTPVQVFIAEHKSLLEDTRGLYKLDDTGKKIYIQRQNQSSSPAPGMLTQGIRMSAAEVYAHELIHHITHFGLNQNAELRNQVSDLYNLAYDSFKDTYGNNAFRVFMNDPNADLTDAANAHEIVAAKARWDYVFNPVQRADKSFAALDEFLSFGMTNENFKRELDKLSVTPEMIKKRQGLLGIFEKNIQTTIVNLFTKIMDFVQTTFNHQQHSSNVAVELENLVKALSLIENKQANVLFQAAGEAEAKTTAFGVTMDNKIKDVASKVMSTTAIGKMMAELKKLPEVDNMIGHQMRLAMLWYNDQEQGIVPTLFNEMKGVTERFRVFYDMLGNRKLVLDGAKNDVAQVIRDTLNQYFKRKLESHEKSAMGKTLLKGDISSLLDKNSLQVIRGFIDNKVQRQAEVDRLLGEIQAVLTPVIKNPARIKQYMTFFEGGVTDLAYGMITGHSFKQGVNYRNANNLALMNKTGFDGSLTDSTFSQVVELLDRAASVKSMDYMKMADKKIISNLMKEDISAIENVLNSHKLLKEQILTDLFYDNPALMEKGYTKTILNSRVQMEFGTIHDEQRLADQGFTRNGELKRDPTDPVQDTIYVYTNVGGGTINDLQEGIVSFQQNKTKGVNSYDIQHQIGNQVNPEFAADANNAKVLRATEAKIKVMLQSSARTTGVDLGENYLTPKFDTKGNITNMRYVMSEFAKDTYLQQFSEFDSILGAMASTRVDKIVTPEINQDVVIALKDMWDTDREKYPGSFVKIGPHSDHARYRDIYNMFPPKMKQQILSYWGKNEMMIPQDIVDLVFGQRKYSISEMFGKTKEERNVFESLVVEGMQFALGFENPFVDSDKQVQSVLGRTANRAKTIEDFLVQLTKLTKANIVVRNFFVTWGNHVSNVMYLKSKGIPLKDIIPLQREAFSSALRYQADNSKLQVLLQKREVTAVKQSLSAAERSVMVTNMTREIKRLENEIAINPSTAMIAAGLLPSIVDDVDTGHIQSPFKFGLNKAIDTGLSKLHPTVEKVGRTIFMTEDTEGYRMLNNAVKMTDYVGRYVLYKHYTKEGMTHDNAVSKVTDEFIDFAPPTHRMIEYANNVGLMWFTKYQLRVLKHIKNVVAEHPFSTLATFIIGHQLGNQNILNSIPGVTKGMLSFIGNPLSALLSGGPKILYVNGLEHVGEMLMGD